MKKQILLLLMMLLPLVASAKFVEIDGINYELVSKAKEAEVSAHTKKYSGDVIIPASVTYEGVEYNVTSIGKSAFSGSIDMTSITIPSSVKAIKNMAFASCKSLTAVHISDLEAWCSIAFSTSDCNPLYYAHHLFLNGEEIKDLVIPDGVTSILESTFNDCTALISVTIPSSVKSIRNWAFDRCSGLTAVHISDLEAWCNITFYSNPLAQAHHLFLNGEEIKDLVIPNGLTNIRESTFAYCSGLTSITIPNSVTSIEGFAFSNCTGLTSITIPNSVTSIGERAFSECTGLTSVTIPNSVTTIGEQAFFRCEALPSITIPGSVTSIEESAFYACLSLNSVTISDGVKSIGKEAFAHCSLTSIAIPSSVTSIGENAFTHCSGLTSVHITDLEAWCNIFFHSGYCSNPLYYAHRLFLNGEKIKDLVIPNSMTSIGASAFYCCNSLTSVTIPGSVTTIGGSAFRNCENLNTVVIQDGVTTIGTYAFLGCTDLDSIAIPNSVTSIGGGAFGGCRCLTSITLPNSVKTIEGSIFENCERLATVTIGSGIEKVDALIFDHCDALTDVYCYTETVPSTHYNAFHRSPYRSATLHVPYASIKAYKSADPWKDFGSIVPLDDADGIVSVHKDYSDTTPKYDLQGRRLNAQPSKGVYIQEGKKYVTK